MSIYLFEDFVFDTDRRELRRKEALVGLEPQVFDLLAYLIRQHDRVVSREELVASVWNGRAISDSALTTRLNAVRSAINDDGRSQRLIRTLRGRGVRFVGAVHEQPTWLEVRRTHRVPDSPDHALPVHLLPDQPSVAVLPFINMSDEVQPGYFVDGIVEDIITALSKWRWFFVICRNSTFVYKDCAYDVRQVGHELGVRYLLEGSIRKSGRRLRISVQLIEAATGIELWAERFNGVLNDLFDLQDAVTERTVAAIEPQLRAAELRRIRNKRPESLTAYDYYLQALPPSRSLGADATGEALRLLSLAWGLDRNYAAAYGLASYCYRFRRQQGWSTAPSEDAKLGMRLAERALQCDPEDPFVLWTAGHAITALAQDHGRARTLIDRSLALNPNSAQAWSVSGWNHEHMANRAAALSDFQRALRLSPLDPMKYFVLAGISAAHMNLHEYEKAIEYARQSVREEPTFASGWRMLAVSLAYLGRRKEAREAVARMRGIDAGITVEMVDRHRCNLVDPEERKHYLDGLRLAGLPEK